MKKLLLFVFTICIAFLAFTQERVPAVSSDLTKQSFERKSEILREPASPMVEQGYTIPRNEKSAPFAGVETEIIETVYDLQSNAAIGNRFWVWEDGTMAAVTTKGMESPGWPDRGTGYNYFDGSEWGPQPAERIESRSAGWPSIAPWGDNGEIVVAHTTGAPYILLINRRENKGVGAWEELEYPGPGGAVEPTWPRIASTGENNEYLHMFYNSYNAYEGQELALLYSRSNDGGTTWLDNDEILAGLGADDYNEIRADSYILASKNNTIVLLHANAWADMFLMRSDDNGENWEKTIIWEHPYPFFDFNSTLMDDTLYSVDNSANIAIDDNGMVHVVWGIGRVARLAAAPPEPGEYSYWPFTDGIGYWNESMGQIPEADNPHHTMMPEYLEDMGMLIGWTHDVNNSGFIFDFEGTAETPFAVYRSLGISTMPTIAINGNMIALAYASVTETFTTTDGLYNYHHIWTRFSYDLGQTWGELFTDIQANEIFHLYDECIYPVLGPNANADGAFQLIYNADTHPGLHLDDEHDPVINRVIHNLMDYTIGIDEPTASKASLSVLQSYPNPTNGITDIVVETAQPAAVGVEIFNMTGQKVMDIPSRQLSSGAHTLRFDASSLTSGVYFYSVTSGAETITHKMIVQ
jgi:hypothetical protein